MATDYARYETGRGTNFWAVDLALQTEVERTYPTDEYAWAVERLDHFGELIGSTVTENSDLIDANGPTLHTYDRDGELINEVEYHPAQYENERAVYGAGIVADSFRPPPGREERVSLLHNLTMDYLLSYADIGLTCPVAMTAGAAIVLEAFDDGTNQEYLDGLVSRDYDELLQGAMFLTEHQGGSDVGAIETIAEPDEGNVYRLSGEKWFCSNIDAEVVLTLARRPGAPDGTDGLSLFLVPRTTRDGRRNHYIARRLKDKLGTISVPTGEVEFEETEAYLVGEPECGFRYMAEMLNFERLSNAFGACGAIGRAVLESKIKAANRETFGARLDEHPLMRRDLVELSVAHEAATAFTFDTAVAYDRAIRGEDSDAFGLMRALVPVAKHRTGRLAVDITSYAMEIQGGNGYVADWVTNRMLRDAQVLPIWEGPSNILSLDLLRAMVKERSHEAVAERIAENLADVRDSLLGAQVSVVEGALEELESAFGAVLSEGESYAQFHAKSLANLLYDVYTSSLLLKEAQSALDDGEGRKTLVARQFIDDTLCESEARGISSGDQLPDEWYKAIVEFEPVEPSQLAESLTVVE